MKTVRFPNLDRDARWSARVVGLAVVMTFAIFMLLPIAEMIHKSGRQYRLRTVETLDILKAPPPMPPKMRKPKTRPRPQLREMSRKLNPMMIQAALQVDPGFGDFQLDFGMLGQVEGDSLVFALAEVDEPPEAVRKIQPVYPAKARLKKIGGHVVVSVVVQPDGSVDDVKIQSAEPKDIFESAAIQAVKRWRFSPGVRGGRKVRTRVLIPMDFEI